MASGDNATVEFVEVGGTKMAKKVSRTIDYSLELEKDILTKTNSLNCPNICQLLDWDEKEPALFLERIDGKELFEMLEQIDVDVLISLINRGLVTAAVLNEEFDIVHNDLHGGNVMVKSCSFDYSVYIFPDDQEFAFETFGVEPVLIDFGLAFPGECSDRMRMTIMYTNFGYFPFETDRLADARRITKIPMNRTGPVADRFNRKINYMFNDFPLDEASGWFVENTFTNLTELILKEMTRDLETLKKRSQLMEAIFPSDRLVDLFAAQILFPVSKPPATFDISDSFKNFFVAYERMIEKFHQVFSVESHAAIVKYVMEHSTETISRTIFKTEETRIDCRTIEAVKKACEQLVMAIQEVIFENISQMSAKKMHFNQSCACSSVREVAFWLTERVKFFPGTSLRVYSVEERKNFSVKVTERLANELNSKTITFKRLIEK